MDELDKKSDIYVLEDGQMVRAVDSDQYEDALKRYIKRAEMAIQDGVADEENLYPVPRDVLEN